MSRIARVKACRFCKKDFIVDWRLGKKGAEKRKYCGTECQRLGAIGRKNDPAKLRTSLEKRFWAKVDKKGLDECWPWTGQKTPLGYGHIMYLNKLRIATRIMWELVHGYEPVGLEMCHKCDNPPCVNPNHIFAAIHKEHFRDALRRGRDSGMFKAGTQHRLAKLTAEDVKQIRSLYVPFEFGCRKLAKRFNVSDETIRRIVINDSYKEV